MVLSCVQMNVTLNRPEQNVVRVERLIRQAAKKKPDVIVLPETWNIGFAPRSIDPALADEEGLRTKAMLSGLAKKYNVNIVGGSVVIRRNGNLYNTCYVFSRAGECVAEYDKTHLFSPSGEAEMFTAGDKLARFTLDGVPCAVIICYDIRFPELVRSLALSGLDLLFVVAEWPKTRVKQLDLMLRARAIENQCYVALCNGCGAADGIRFGGGSAVVGPLGESLALAGARERIISASVEIETLKPMRKAPPVFFDRRPELYGALSQTSERQK